MSIMKKNNFVVVVVCFFLVVSLVGNVYFVSKMNESAQGETPPSENPENAEVDMTQENADRYSDEIDIIELDDANSRDTYFSIHNIR